MATTPFVYCASFGGLSTVLYPGPPLPLAVGSPPWITKPGTMRWKIVFLKKPAFASATIEADACGPRFRSSLTVKFPQLVLNSSAQDLPESSAFDGFFCLPGCRGFGAFAIDRQPLAVPAAGLPLWASVDGGFADGMSAVDGLLLEPQLASGNARTANARSRRRTAQQGTDLRLVRRAPLPSAPALRAGHPRPRRLRVGRAGRRARLGGGDRRAARGRKARRVRDERPAPRGRRVRAQAVGHRRAGLARRRRDR